MKASEFGAFILGIVLGMFINLIVPAHGQTVLPDSETSSANPKGTDLKGKPTPAMDGPFNISCYSSADFAANTKKKGAILIMYGFDPSDLSVIMTFKFKDGSLAMARTNKDGSMTCQYATVMEPEYDVRAVLKGQERDQ